LSTARYRNYNMGGKCLRPAESVKYDRRASTDSYKMRRRQSRDMKSKVDRMVQDESMFLHKKLSADCKQASSIPSP